MNVDTRTPTEIGKLRTFVELDFFGSSGTESISNAHNPRLRHAFGSLGPVLAGQTWTTFLDVGSYPETIDFGGPAGQTFIRQAQIRYTHELDKKTKLMFSVENPETIIGNTSSSGSAENGRDKMPDIIVRGIHSDTWGHVSLSGVGRLLNADNGSIDDQEPGWGLGLGAKFNVGEKDNIKLQANGGDGIGRYLLATGSNSGGAVLNTTTGELETVSAYGGYVSYQHWWNSKIRSTAIFGIATADNPAVADVTDVETVKSVHTNLMWSPVPKVNLGVEYSLFDADFENNTEGQISRIQFGAQYKF